MELTIILSVILIRLTGSTANSLECDKIDKTMFASSHTSHLLTDDFASPSLIRSKEKKNQKKCELRLSSLNVNEISEFEAIQILHRQLDDDKNGNVDLVESKEFLREELQYKKGYQMRHENFHKNNDDQISVKELWLMWKSSHVYNWTVEQTVDWVGTVVELPEYQEKFRQLKINGTYLPRLAVNHQNFLTVDLGIKDIIAKQKLSLKAQDVVLFGPPKKDTGSRVKDVIFVVLLVSVTCVSYYVYCCNVKMSRDLETLKKSEELLRELQTELEREKQDEEMHRKNMDGFLNDIIPAIVDIDEVVKLQDEVKLLRVKLHRAEVELQLKRWIPPPELIHLLQLTYDLETREHKRKQEAAEKLLMKANKACEKLRKRRSNFLNAFVNIRQRSIDDVDTAVLNARMALTEITNEHQERTRRWKHIEALLNSDRDIQSNSIISSQPWSRSTSLITARDATQINGSTNNDLHVTLGKSRVPSVAPT